MKPVGRHATESSFPKKLVAVTLPDDDVIATRPVHDRECEPASFAALVVSGTARPHENASYIEARARRMVERRKEAHTVRCVKQAEILEEDKIAALFCAVCGQPILRGDLLALLPVE